MAKLSFPGLLFRVLRAHRVLLDHKGRRVRLVKLVHKDLKENKVRRESKERQDHRAILESRGRKAFQATPALKAPKDLKVR